MGRLFRPSFMPKLAVRTVFAARLAEAREAAGFSQTELGRRIGLTDEAGSVRINRYERGKHLPDLETAERLAKELGVSLPWLVCTDPRLAEMIEGFSKLDAAGQTKLLAALRKVGGARGAK